MGALSRLGLMKVGLSTFSLGVKNANKVAPLKPGKWGNFWIAPTTGSGYIIAVGAALTASLTMIKYATVSPVNTDLLHLKGVGKFLLSNKEKGVEYITINSQELFQNALQSRKIIDIAIKASPENLYTLFSEHQDVFIKLYENLHGTDCVNPFIGSPITVFSKFAKSANSMDSFKAFLTKSTEIRIVEVTDNVVTSPIIESSPTVIESPASIRYIPRERVQSTESDDIGRLWAELEQRQAEASAPADNVDYDSAEERVNMEHNSYQEYKRAEIEEEFTLSQKEAQDDLSRIELEASQNRELRLTEEKYEHDEFIQQSIAGQADFDDSFDDSPLTAGIKTRFSALREKPGTSVENPLYHSPLEDEQSLAEYLLSFVDPSEWLSWFNAVDPRVIFYVITYYTFAHFVASILNRILFYLQSYEHEPVSRFFSAKTILVIHQIVNLLMFSLRVGLIFLIILFLLKYVPFQITYSPAK